MGFGIFYFTAPCGKKGEPITEEEEQFALRSDFVNLMRISRIAGPGALYDADVSASTPETIPDTIINPIDFEEIADVDVAKAIGANPHSHIPGFEEFIRNSPKVANMLNVLEKIKKVGKSQTHVKVRNLLYLQKDIKKLKSSVWITIRLHIAEWGGSEMSTEERCEDENILTKWV